MKLQYAIRRLLVAVTWSLAIATWGAIAHFFLGAPDLGPAIPAAAGALIGAAPLFRLVSARTVTASQTATR